MAIHKENIIDIPKGTFIHKRNNNEYVYVYTKFYRNDDGKSRNKSLCIGKKIDATSKMHPNDNYFLHFKIEKKYNDEVKKIGFSSVVDKCFNEIGLKDILASCFGDDRANLIKIISSYLIQGGESMSYVDHFTEEHCFFTDSYLVSSQRVSELFESIMETGLTDFFKEWIKKTTENQYIYYDVTSVSTYSDWIDHAEYGYNRDGDELKQINIGLFTAENSRLPVYYENYNGSLTDKSNVINVVKNAKYKGLNNVKLVLDGGFFDKKRILELYDSGLIFTIGMPGKLKESKKIISENKSDLYSIQYSTTYQNTFGKLIDYELFGIKGRIFVGLDTKSRNLKLDDINRKIAQYKYELENTKSNYDTIIKQKKYKSLFKITKEENSKGFSFELDENKVEEASSYYGYFLVFTTDMNATATDIIYHYREKDADEKMFYALKNYDDLDRLRTHKQKTTDGKLFVSFIALILRSWLNQKVGEYKTRKHLTLTNIINKLSDIQILHTKAETRYIKSVTKEQNEILECFGLDENIIDDIIKIYNL